MPRGLRLPRRLAGPAHDDHDGGGRGQATTSAGTQKVGGGIRTGAATRQHAPQALALEIRRLRKTFPASVCRRVRSICGAACCCSCRHEGSGVCGQLGRSVAGMKCGHAAEQTAEHAAAAKVAVRDVSLSLRRGEVRPPPARPQQRAMAAVRIQGKAVCECNVKQRAQWIAPRLIATMDDSLDDSLVKAAGYCH